MLINKELEEKIIQYRSWNEEQRMIHPDILEVIYQQGWFKILIPKSLSGGEWSLPKAISLFEALASIDANVGWAVNLAAGANMFAGYFEPTIAQQIFNHPKVACAGSGAILGTAVKIKDKYVVNGTWRYASGAAHASHFTANCWLKDENGADLLNEDGSRKFRSFIFSQDQVHVHDSWYSLGLKATSSHDFSVHNIEVPEEWTFNLLTPSKMAEGPLYQFPFATMAVVNMSSMIIGIGKGFLKEWEKLMEYKKPLHASEWIKDERFIQDQYRKVKNNFEQHQQKAHHNLEQLWKLLEEGQELTFKQYTELEIQYHQTVLYAYEMVTTLYPYFGMTIVFDNSPVQKMFRDFMTASQHYQMHPIQKSKKQQLLEKESAIIS